MKIGCPTEIKPQEFRVGMTPDAAREAVNHGHTVYIQQGAGLGAGADLGASGAAGAVARRGSGGADLARRPAGGAGAGLGPARCCQCGGLRLALALASVSHGLAAAGRTGHPRRPDCSIAPGAGACAKAAA